MAMTDEDRRDLNVWISEHVMGWIPETRKMYAGIKNCKGWGKNTHLSLGDANRKFTLSIDPPENYTTDPAAAMEVLKKCLKSDKRFGGIMFFDSQVSSVPCFTVMAGSIGNLKVQAQTLELAICLFAKKLFSK